MTMRLVTIDALARDMRHGMFSLLDRCFVGVDREQFDHDLSDKTHALVMMDAAGGVVGLSTFALYGDVGPDRKPATIVCSGDTIVAPEAWGSTTLPRTWISAVRGLHETIGRGRLYWLLITSGFRTYRFLPVFFRHYYPCVDGAAPDGERAWIDALAARRWGDAYDVATGIVRFARPQRLRGQLADVPPGKVRDRHVAYYLERNPGHAAGDELVSVTSLADANLTRAGVRMLVAGRKRAAQGVA